MKKIWAGFTRNEVIPGLVALLSSAGFVVALLSDANPSNGRIDLPPWLLWVFWLSLLLLVPGLLGLIEASNRRRFGGDKSRDTLRNLTTTLDAAGAAIAVLKQEIADRSRYLDNLKGEIASIESLSKMSAQQIEDVLLAVRRTSSRTRDWVLVTVGGVIGAAVGLLLQLLIL